jgi:hypothetical protein
MSYPATSPGTLQTTSSAKRTKPFLPSRFINRTSRHGHRTIAGLLALKDAPDDVLLDQVRAIGVTASRYTLFDGTDRPQHTNLPAATDCAALGDRIDALIRPARLGSVFQAD